MGPLLAARRGDPASPCPGARPTRNSRSGSISTPVRGAGATHEFHPRELVQEPPASDMPERSLARPWRPGRPWSSPASARSPRPYTGHSQNARETRGDGPGATRATSVHPSRRTYERQLGCCLQKRGSVFRERIPSRARAGRLSGRTVLGRSQTLEFKALLQTEKLDRLPVRGKPVTESCRLPHQPVLIRPDESVLLRPCPGSSPVSRPELDHLSLGADARIEGLKCLGSASRSNNPLALAQLGSELGKQLHGGGPGTLPAIALLRPFSDVLNSALSPRDDVVHSLGNERQLSIDRRCRALPQPDRIHIKSTFRPVVLDQSSQPRQCVGDDVGAGASPKTRLCRHDLLCLAEQDHAADYRAEIVLVEPVGVCIPLLRSPVREVEEVFLCALADHVGALSPGVL